MSVEGHMTRVTHEEGEGKGIGLKSPREVKLQTDTLKGARAPCSMRHAPRSAKQEAHGEEAHETA